MKFAMTIHGVDVYYGTSKEARFEIATSENPGTPGRIITEPDTPVAELNGMALVMRSLYEVMKSQNNTKCSNVRPFKSLNDLRLMNEGGGTA